MTTWKVQAAIEVVLERGEVPSDEEVRDAVGEFIAGNQIHVHVTGHETIECGCEAPAAVSDDGICSGCGAQVVQETFSGSRVDLREVTASAERLGGTGC